MQSAVRGAHLLWPTRLPDRLGIYFHGLPAAQWEAFASAIETVRDLGYEFVGLPDLYERTTGKLAFISFDDSHRNWVDALPLLDDLGIRATFYVNTLPMRDTATPQTIEAFARRIEEDPATYVPLTQDEVAELDAAGHTIGAHTHSHRALVDLPEHDALEDIATNRRLLEDLLGRPVAHFAYPFGLRRYFSERLRAACLDQGFESVADATPGYLHAGQRREAIQRTPWNLERSARYNLANLRIDGRLFERVTKRAATPC